jgi:hypothetical protein
VNACGPSAAGTFLRFIPARTVNKAAQVFFVLRSSLVALTATHAGRRASVWGDSSTRPAPVLVHEVASTALSRAEFGCHYTDLEIE